MKHLRRLDGQHNDRRAPHGARGLKRLLYRELTRLAGRAPHGARGLKLHPRLKIAAIEESRPARGAWIETSQSQRSESPLHCRAPHGARGLKHISVTSEIRRARRAPHGARGLKRPSEGSNQRTKGRAPHGARGLKRQAGAVGSADAGRAPHGARGLKPLKNGGISRLKVQLVNKGARKEVTA